MKRAKESSTWSRLYLSGVVVFGVILHPAAEGMAAPLGPAGMLPDRVGRGTAPVIPPKPDTATKARIVEAYGKLPLSFEANHGQADAQVKYLARGRGYTLFLTETDAVLILRNEASAISGKRSARTDQNKKPSRTLLRMQLVGVNPHPKVVGLNKLPGKSNYFIGNNPKNWRTHVPNYTRVRYQDVYPGVDLLYYGKQRQLEYDFVIAPGADPNSITLAFDGAERLEINDQGDLVLHIAGGKVIQHAPVIYQEINGVNQAINGHYVLRGKHQVGFHVATYDATKPLIIDPVLVYSTYLGGVDIDRGNGIAVDGTGNAYVTGPTDTSELEVPPFPTTAGAFDTVLAGNTDAFVTKLNAAGDALIYSTYLGGSDIDQGNDIAVDAAGNAYVTGFTFSADFPFTAGFFQPALASPVLSDAFVAKVNAAGTALTYSTYLGGSDIDQGQDIALEPACPMNCSAYVTGFTVSGDFPFTAGAFDTTFNGVQDAFVTKLNATGTAPLTYSTYLGGTLTDQANSIAVDAGGSAYVAGSTDSGGATPFPTTAGAFDTTLGGVTDVFVTKLNATGTAPLTYSTYLGGSDIDLGNGIALDSVGNAYVTGSTVSADFPTAGSPFQPNLASPVLTDAFATKLNPAGAGAADLVYSTYLGGSDVDQGNDIAVDLLDNAYVVGETVSPNFPIASFQATFGGVTDAFVSKITEMLHRHGGVRVGLGSPGAAPAGVPRSVPAHTFGRAGVCFSLLQAESSARRADRRVGDSPRRRSHRTGTSTRMGGLVSVVSDPWSGLPPRGCRPWGLAAPPGRPTAPAYWA
jgi:hypothetical protein